MNISKIKLLF